MDSQPTVYHTVTASVSNIGLLNTRNHLASSSLLSHLSITTATTSSLSVTQIDRQITLDSSDNSGGGRGKVEEGRWHRAAAGERKNRNKMTRRPSPARPPQIPPVRDARRWHDPTGRLLPSLADELRRLICLSFVCRVTAGPRVAVHLLSRRSIPPPPPTPPSGTVSPA